MSAVCNQEGGDCVFQTSMLQVKLLKPWLGTQIRVIQFLEELSDFSTYSAEIPRVTILARRECMLQRFSKQMKSIPILHV